MSLSSVNNLQFFALNSNWEANWSVNGLPQERLSYPHEIPPNSLQWSFQLISQHKTTHSLEKLLQKTTNYCSLNCGWNFCNSVPLRVNFPPRLCSIGPCGRVSIGRAIVGGGKGIGERGVCKLDVRNLVGIKAICPGFWGRKSWGNLRVW